MQNDVKYDQYYTNEAVAADCYRVFCEHFNPIFCKMVEPSAGTGSFFKLLPSRSLGYDVEPKHPGIRQADFLTVEIRSEWKVAVIGNPPFGKNASMAVRFFNHAAREARIIAMIVPRTFRKAKIQNRLDRNFHLVREVAVPKNAFVFRNRRYDVPTIFQIWERRPEPRARVLVETTHPDFAFTSRDDANFAIRRIGARAGRIVSLDGANPSTHYFIRGDVEAIMRQLDFASAAANVAGIPSLAKSEIVALYKEWIKNHNGL